MNKPARDIKLARPTAFIAAVLPPVFGPVITTARVVNGTNTSTGTGPFVAGVLVPDVDTPDPPLPSPYRNSSSYASAPPSSSFGFLFLLASFLAANRRA
jgi:hypothetical protein